MKTISRLTKTASTSASKKLNNKRVDPSPPPSLPLGLTLVADVTANSSMSDFKWSRDGAMAATSYFDGVVELWDSQLRSKSRLLSKISANCVSFNPSGELVAIGRGNGAIEIWHVHHLRKVRTVKAHSDAVAGVAWSARHQLASCSTNDGTKLWNTTSWTAKDLTPSGDVQLAVAWSADSMRLASVGYNADLYSLPSGDRTHVLEGGGGLYDAAWSNDESSRWLATGTARSGIGIWDTSSGSQLASLEGHTDHVRHVHFSCDNHLLVSAASDGAVKLWDCADWREVASVSASKPGKHTTRSIAFHPQLPMLAIAGDSDSGSSIVLYKYDIAALARNATSPSVIYTSAKIVLVGDSGVGKTGLGWRLVHGDFKEHSSTHGQQFWLLSQLRKRRKDGADCEAVLWDLAGQDDYRLIHALFLDDTDLALVLFDPSRHDDLLGGAEYWLKQLKAASGCSKIIPVILIAARADRGEPRFTREEIEQFCALNDVECYLPTSAMTGTGVDDLVAHMQSLIPWESKPSTVTTDTFKKIKDFVLNLKGNARRRKVILSPEELRQRIRKTQGGAQFRDDEILAAIGHLATHGYVTRLKNSRGEQRILLVPELLNNLAASFVLEARRNRKGLGSLEESRLFSGGYQFPELDRVTSEEGVILVESAATLFLDHNICFRETDPLTGQVYLVFPELINLKRPVTDAFGEMIDGPAYTASGAVENVYASLVVLMGYTQTFNRTNQWRDYARYEVGKGQLCGFRLEAERPGELDFVLSFGSTTPPHVQLIFQGLFEGFLARRNLKVNRFNPVVCPSGHFLNRAVIREHTARNQATLFCSQCGEKVVLPRSDQRVALGTGEAEAVQLNRRSAESRTRFEQALYRLKQYVAERNLEGPDCFISYAWGDSNHEKWVEKYLASDMQKAGVRVVLDKWENARIGASVPRFVERLAKCRYVVVVGTPLYRTKYENSEPMRGYVVAAEGDLIGSRLIGRENEKASVLPALLEGSDRTAFPDLLQGRVYADFRETEKYFAAALALILRLYEINPKDAVAIDLQEMLTGYLPA